MKKTFIVIGCVLGALFVLLLVGIICIILWFPGYKHQKAIEQNQRVIDYFRSRYVEDIGEIEITSCASLGTGSPVPFAGKGSTKIYEYKLRVNKKYQATVWVIWEDESFSLKQSDFPGTLIE